MTDAEDMVRFWDAPPGVRPAGNLAEHPELAARARGKSVRALSRFMAVCMFA